MSVKRMRDGGGDVRKRAIIRFAILETVGFIPFVLTLIWVHLAGPERPVDEAMRLTVIAAVAFAIYVGILFFVILLPVIKGRADAR
jgi:hypothetical protein